MSLHYEYFHSCSPRARPPSCVSMSPQRKIICHRCWSGYIDVGVLEGVSQWLGYMVFERWYWMIMMLSRRHSKWHCVLECFLVGTYRGWSETFWRTPSFRWQACKTKNPQAKAWEPGGRGLLGCAIRSNLQQLLRWRIRRPLYACCPCVARVLCWSQQLWKQ